MKSPAKKTGVWWDTNTDTGTSCYFPEEYDPYKVRQSIESAFKDHLPLTITAIGNLKRMPHPLWEPILSSGIVTIHSHFVSTTKIMHDMYDWADNNPAPAELILITDRINRFEVSGFLPSLRDRGYTIVTKPWKNILSAACNETTSKKDKKKCIDTAWVCHTCIDSGGLTFAGESYESLTRHFVTSEHIYQEFMRSPDTFIKNRYFISVEDAKKLDFSSTGVWWDIDTCLVPQGFDPRQVRQRLDSAFVNHLPLTISAVGNLERIPPGVLGPILSTGIIMKHGLEGPVDISKDMERWARYHPPPATIILISDHEQVFLTNRFLLKLKDLGYTIIRAYANHPQVSPKYASQTMLWDYLLADTNQETTSTEIMENVWVCSICMKPGHTFAGESYKSLKRHFKSVEHKIQVEAITMAKSQSEASLNTSISMISMRKRSLPSPQTSICLWREEQGEDCMARGVHFSLNY
ncbi:unnamed protein product [Microthlaspi erraticum]|uniref:NYN domain-containing protein n=1 Tax=Microthlaspi erraticum TaxID=1685480 RepID=A0A6D2KS31_9BRAS|nr:unnamed protein product [Microthlaspi erraticum]